MNEAMLEDRDKGWAIFSKVKTHQKKKRMWSRR